MQKITTKREFVKLFSEVTNLNTESSQMVVESVAYFMEYCIDNSIEFRVSGFPELYFSKMRERENVKIVKEGSTERIVLPPSLTARLRLPENLRKKQKEQNKIMRPLLKEMMKEDEEIAP